MYVANQIAAALALLGEPFLPFTTKKLVYILGFDKLRNQLNWQSLITQHEFLPAGHILNEASLLFTKVEDEAIEKQLEKLQQTKTTNALENRKAEPQKTEVTFEDFAAMDIRVGTILEAEKMPKADKLLVLKVDTGIDVRTIVSGIAQHFSAEEVIGKKVSVLVNLAPRKLRGVESQGMILMTENKNGKLTFIMPENAQTMNGSTIN
jgi:methionyl-tRNA synthetase